MESAIEIDADAVAELCREYGVARLRIFGSAVTGEFDPASSDVDFIVDFLPEHTNLFSDYFGLREGLTDLLGRNVDLVVGRSMRNPYFKQSALSSARDVFVA
ncbi:nucleotidyltransferase family protein [Brevibacterium oceani]|uniref:nucleotidyltransferase family protein n=1 Tax=Brevibacterium oceani TaxID=358099 RepID=UPI0015E73110|nr:nucleotidyltransferase domain-containing protein [Brevibacterium oceani]